MNTLPTRNLLILQTVPEQDPADWIAIKEIIERKAPDIEVRIANVTPVSLKKTDASDCPTSRFPSRV
jgi:hypothetical protein